ncbi:MAG: ComF family protein [Alphaproteobacteria bacterium]|nr:MAG: ComF family protein [Alphaproteobacteria bacterium]
MSGLVAADVWRRLPNLIFPPRCLSCETAISEVGALCADCWLGVTFVDGAVCQRCGQPFELDPGVETVCGGCLQSPPLYDRARAVFLYNDASRALVTGFKYGDRTDRVPSFGRWLARAGRELIDDADVLIPVPLHWTRLFQRRFNQSALLAQAIHKETLVPVLLEGLERSRSTQQQVGLSNAKRRRNVRGAFKVPEKQIPHVLGRKVVLIDDVVTSGATVEACTRALKKAGAARVDVLALARVLR